MGQNIHIYRRYVNAISRQKVSWILVSQVNAMPFLDMANHWIAMLS